jgi:phosphoenolpyruvate synthase/pyruvate phosphate dikinase
MHKLLPKDYERLFRFESIITCLHSELFFSQFKGRSPLLIYKNRIWESFINKKQKKAYLNEGLKLFSSKHNYSRYSRSFRQYIRYAKKKIIPKYSKEIKSLSKVEFLDLIEQFKKFSFFYGFTENFYHDLAFEMMQKNKTLRTNLKNLGYLKIEARKVLNKFIFKEGVYNNILLYFSNKYLSNKDDANYLYIDELTNLFSGVKINYKTIEQRKKCYAATKYNGRIFKFDYNSSLGLSNSFTVIENKNILKGAVANKGIAKGQVIIAPMLTDIKKVNQLKSKMRKGYILVAQSTTPELTPLIKKAAAIVTDQGGMLSHAAVISRELRIPCIVGTCIATRILKNGDLVEVDANKGIVHKL